MYKTAVAFALLPLIGVGRGHAQQAGNGTLREGTHRLTLQWITNSPKDAGTAEITRADAGTYTIKGRQDKGKDGFVTVNGTLEVLSPRELLFTGEIDTACSFIYEGKVCVKKGTFHFLAKGARRFWRLQNMQSCDGTSVDYVDVSF